MTDTQALAIVAGTFTEEGVEDSHELRVAIARIALMPINELHSLVDRMQMECKNESGLTLRDTVQYRRNKMNDDQRRETSVKLTRQLMALEYIGDIDG